MTNGSSQGLFVIVAVVIFGIFVLISYVLFRDTLKPNLSTIFTDSLVQVEKNLNGGDENNISYVLLREAYDTHSAIYAKVKDNETGGVTIIGVSKTEDGEYRKDNDYNSYLGLTGEISFDKKINGKNITEIEDGVFMYSKFTGEFNAPELNSISVNAFLHSKFTGVFNAPKVTSVGIYAFDKSTFTGEFNAPNVTEIGVGAFDDSEFSGSFNTPKVTSIGGKAFKKSRFTGDFNAPKLTEIGFYAFQDSEFTGDFNANELEDIGNIAFQNSQFTSAYAPKLEIIGKENGTLNTLLKK